MGPSSILSITHTITIDTVLNFNNGGNNGHGLKNVRCKQILNRQHIYPERFFFEYDFLRLQ